MKPLAPNTLLQNRYLIIQLVGKGGMGEVYLAVDQRLGSAIALKRTFFKEDEMLNNAFEREAKTLARLRHPVLPKVSDHFSEGENQFLVMEHISGEDLSKRLDTNKKPFPLNWVLFWADQLLDALNYLHSNNPPIIHRDIKPQNLKLTDENNIVLLDFGLSKDTVGQTRISSTGSVVGYTPHYAPMEQIRGTGTNAKSDIYSLSATLYQLLTNNVPVDALTRADSILSGIDDPLIPIYELNPEVPKPISDIIIKGMTLSQEQRFSNAREMQKALRDAYSKLQNAMAAQTLMFSSPAEALKQEIPQAAQKPESLNTLVENQMPPANLNSQPETSTNDKTEHMSFSKPEESAGNFDATIPYDPSSFDSLPKQSDIKTEVFLSGDLMDTNEEKFPVKEENGVPEAAAPILLDSQPRTEKAEPQAKSEFDSIPRGLATDVYDNFVPTEDFSNVKEVYSEEENTPEEKVFTPPQNIEESYSPAPPTPAYAAAPPQKTSNTKYIAILGGLFAFFILVIGVAGGGWYAYNNYFAVKEDPKPQPTPVATPSVESTPEERVEFGSNTGETNSDITSADNTNSSETNTVTTDENVGSTTKPTPVQGSTPRPNQVQASTPRPTPQIATQKTPKPAPDVKKTPEPKKTPVKGGRTDILQ
ncbi:MAG TPA: protein kinase [Pyrinomonadaceae bacterium]|nr:protein kinase [Pyrinomonadaceae bacterium]